MNSEYNNSILILDGAGCRVTISGTQMIFSCQVLQRENSRSLEISASDIKGKYWEVIINHEDFINHLDKLGIFKSDWKAFFDIMSNGITEGLIKGEIVNEIIHLHIDYPIGEASLRGTFHLMSIKNPAPRLIAELVFRFIDRLERKNLKRVREPSPQIRQAITDIVKIKTKPAKKKQPKHIGSKII
jgi:hypothetical protein